MTKKRFIPKAPSVRVAREIVGLNKRDFMEIMMPIMKSNGVVFRRKSPYGKYRNYTQKDNYWDLYKDVILGTIAIAVATGKIALSGIGVFKFVELGREGNPLKPKGKRFRYKPSSVITDWVKEHQDKIDITEQYLKSRDGSRKVNHEEILVQVLSVLRELTKDVISERKILLESDDSDILK